MTIENIEGRTTIIVPALDEERALERLLPWALAQCDDVVIADGGSRDSTRAVARRLGARVVEAPAGRGAQMNAGARSSTRPVLLFLHADTRLPAGGVAAAEAAIAAGAPGGAFLLEFDTAHRLMRFGGRLVRWRTRHFRVPLGDQAIFVHRPSFDAIGGFREWPILEDVDFVRRLKRRGRLAIVPLAVRTDARRFLQRGVLRTVAVNWLIWGLYSLGVDPARLARLYRHVR